MKKYVLLLALLTGSVTVLAQKAKPLIINSPDGKITFRLLVENAKLFYTIDYNNTPVIEKVAMGLVINDYTFGEQLSVATVKRDKSNETYPYRGVHSKTINKYAGAVILFKYIFPFTTEVRVFNAGIAFHYIVNSIG